LKKKGSDQNCQVLRMKAEANNHKTLGKGTKRGLRPSGWGRQKPGIFGMKAKSGGGLKGKKRKN